MVEWDSSKMAYYSLTGLLKLSKNCDRGSIQDLDIALQRLGIVVRCKYVSQQQLNEAENLSQELFKIYRKLKFIEKF